MLLIRSNVKILSHVATKLGPWQSVLPQAVINIKTQQSSAPYCYNGPFKNLYITGHSFSHSSGVCPSRLRARICQFSSSKTLSDKNKCTPKISDCSPPSTATDKAEKACVTPSTKVHEKVCSDAPMGRDYSPCGRFANRVEKYQCMEKSATTKKQNNTPDAKSCGKKPDISAKQDDEFRCTKMAFKCSEGEKIKRDCPSDINSNGKCTKMSFQCPSVSGSNTKKDRCKNRKPIKETKGSKETLSCKRQKKTCKKKKKKNKKQNDKTFNKNKWKKNEKADQSSSTKKCDEIKYKTAVSSKQVKSSSTSTSSLWQKIIGVGQNSTKKFGSSSKDTNESSSEDKPSDKPENNPCDAYVKPKAEERTELKPFFVCKEHPTSCKQEDPSIARGAAYIRPVPDCICHEEPHSSTSAVTPCPQDCTWGGEYGLVKAPKEEECKPKKEKEDCTPVKVHVQEVECVPREKEDDCKSLKVRFQEEGCKSKDEKEDC